jgi:hypothetical protein
MLTNPVYMFLCRGLAIFLLAGALLGVALGLLMIIRPQLLKRINPVTNRWISTRHISKLLDRSTSIEHWLYHRHRPLGILVILGAGYMLAYFGLLFDKAIALQKLSSYVQSVLLDTLLDALVFISLLGGAVALLAGFIIWLRPSLLRGVEKEANQWITSRKATKMLDMQHGDVDIFVAHHARQAGWLLLLGSIYLSFAMLRLLLA